MRTCRAMDVAKIFPRSETLRSFAEKAADFLKAESLPDAVGGGSLVYFTTFGGSPAITPAFDVLGTPLTATPEPGTLALLGIGLLGLSLDGLFGRKRLLG